LFNSQSKRAGCDHALRPRLPVPQRCLLRRAPETDVLSDLGPIMLRLTKSQISDDAAHSSNPDCSHLIGDLINVHTVMAAYAPDYLRNTDPRGESPRQSAMKLQFMAG